MPKSRATGFTPRSIEEVFAIFLCRELNDAEHIRWYAALTRKYSLCLLLNALRRARASVREGTVAPDHFAAALEEITTEERVL